VFIRIMSRAGDDTVPSIETIDRIVSLVGGWPDLNEFKHTSIPR
jgi:hypothetical protein